MEYYNADFEEDKEFVHPNKNWDSCYLKLSRWKDKKKKFDKNKIRNLELGIIFNDKANLPVDLIIGFIPCSSD